VDIFSLPLSRHDWISQSLHRDFEFIRMLWRSLCSFVFMYL